MVTVEKLWPKKAVGRPWAVPFLLIAPISASGDTEVLTPKHMPQQLQILNWRIHSRDTTASNIKLKKNSADITPAVTAKGVTDDAIVPGGTLDLALSKFGLPTDKLYVNSSVESDLTVVFECIWTED